VGINTTGNTPNASAMLDISSSNSGLLIPRVSLLSTTDVTTISSPATSLLVYNTNSGMTGGQIGFYYWNGSQWTLMVSGTNVSGTSWSLTGNVNTIDGTDFIGTTDNVPLNFRVYNFEAGRIDFNLSNAFLGTGAGDLNTTGYSNCYYGTESGLSGTTANGNCFYGAGSGHFNTGSSNCFFGFNSGESNSSIYNSFFGTSSGLSNTTGDNNSFFGNLSGYFNTTGALNTFVGASSGYNNTTASENTFVGVSSGLNNTTGASNVFIGRSAGRYNTTGTGNTSSGYQAGENTTTGSNNIFLGNNSGLANTTGTENTYLGANANGTASLNESVAIGYNATVTANNCLVLGGTGADAVQVGIGVTAPSATLEVNGYTILGTSGSAPKIKMIKLTGTSASTQGGTTSIAHGLTSSKILQVSIFIDYATNSSIPASYKGSSGYEFNYYFDALNIYVWNQAANSGSILSKPFRILIVYEQ